MTIRHLIDPELLPALKFLPELEFSAAALPQIRASLVALARRVPARSDPRVAVEERRIPGRAGDPDVNVLVFRPTDAVMPMAAIIHIHGGGYVLGSPDLTRADNEAVAAELGCVIVSVDYRLAPETPHPGPVEDCYAALTWLRDHAAELGVDPRRIGVSGESAGGGLAAGLALLARDRGDIALAFQHLTYPMIDDRTCIAADPHPYTGEFVWTLESNRFGWQALLGTTPIGADTVEPYAAASRATDLAQLPPTFIATGALDLLLEENLEYARRLARAGVPVELHVYPGAFHGFHLAADARVTIAAKRDSLEALRQFVRLVTPTGIEPVLQP